MGLALANAREAVGEHWRRRMFNEHEPSEEEQTVTFLERHLRTSSSGADTKRPK
jgi:hypothetical protein